MLQGAEGPLEAAGYHVMPAWMLPLKCRCLHTDSHPALLQASESDQRLLLVP